MGTNDGPGALNHLPRAYLSWSVPEPLQFVVFPVRMLCCSLKRLTWHRDVDLSLNKCSRTVYVLSLAGFSSTDIGWDVCISPPPELWVFYLLSKICWFVFTPGHLSVCQLVGLCGGSHKDYWTDFPQNWDGGWSRLRKPYPLSGQSEDFFSLTSFNIVKCFLFVFFPTVS